MIRTEEPDISGVLAAFNQYVHTWHVQHYPEIFWDGDHDLTEYFRTALENPTCHHFIAYDGPKMVGFVQAELISRKGSPFRKPCRLIYINIIVVHPEYRGLGVGRLLIEQVKQLARSQDITRIELDHWEGNDAAEFFAMMGFTPYRHYLNLELDKLREGGDQNGCE